MRLHHHIKFSLSNKSDDLYFEEIYKFLQKQNLTEKKEVDNCTGSNNGPWFQINFVKYFATSWKTRDCLRNFLISSTILEPSLLEEMEEVLSLDQTIPTPSRVRSILFCIYWEYISIF